MPICSRCGTSFAADKAACPRCGQAAATPAFPGQPEGRTPYRTSAFILALGVAAFLLLLATGKLEVRRPVPPAPPAPPAPKAEAGRSYVQRDLVAEALLESSRALWVYKFAGGVPMCWAEIESEGNRKTVGPWVLTKSAVVAGSHPLPQSVEGYVALFGPTSAKQTYRLVCGVTKMTYLPSEKAGLRITAFLDVTEATLPDLLPAVKGRRSAGGTRLEDNGERRPVVPGMDETLNFLINQGTPAGKERSIYLKLRFLTAE